CGDVPRRPSFLYQCKGPDGPCHVQRKSVVSGETGNVGRIGNQSYLRAALWQGVWGGRGQGNVTRQGGLPGAFVGRVGMIREHLGSASSLAEQHEGITVSPRSRRLRQRLAR